MRKFRTSVPPIAFLEETRRARRRSRTIQDSDEDEVDELDESPRRPPAKQKKKNKEKKKTKSERCKLPLDRVERAEIRFLDQQGWSRNFISIHLGHGHQTIAKILTCKETDSRRDEELISKAFRDEYIELRKLGNTNAVNKKKRKRENSKIPKASQESASTRMESGVQTNEDSRPLPSPSHLHREVLNPHDIVPETPPPSSPEDLGQVPENPRQNHTSDERLASANNVLEHSIVHIKGTVTKHHPSTPWASIAQSCRLEAETIDDSDDEPVYLGCHLKDVPKTISIMDPTGARVWLD